MTENKAKSLIGNGLALLLVLVGAAAVIYIPYLIGNPVVFWLSGGEGDDIIICWLIGVVTILLTLSVIGMTSSKIFC